MYIWLIVNEDFLLLLCWDLKMFCVHIINISSLQLSANTIHQATGHLVDIQHYQHPQRNYLVGITV